MTPINYVKFLRVAAEHEVAELDAVRTRLNAVYQPSRDDLATTLTDESGDARWAASRADDLTRQLDQARKQVSQALETVGALERACSAAARAALERRDRDGRVSRWLR